MKLIKDATIINATIEVKGLLINLDPINSLITSPTTTINTTIKLTKDATTINATIEAKRPTYKLKLY